MEKVSIENIKIARKNGTVRVKSVLNIKGSFVTLMSMEFISN